MIKAAGLWLWYWALLLAYQCWPDWRRVAEIRRVAVKRDKWRTERRG